MLRTGDFKVAAVRLVAFTPNQTDFKTSAILATVFAHFANRFDGEVQAIPLPSEAPPDFPRIQLASTDGQWGFAGSPARVTLSWKRTDADESVTIDSIVASCREPLEHHMGENHVQVGRLALVITRVSEVANPAQELTALFCKDAVINPDSTDAPLRHSRSFELHNHKRYELYAGLSINSWVRCRTGTMGNKSLPVVTVEQDVNTLAEETETRRFDVEQSGVFFGECVNEVDDILRKYFP